MSLTEKGVEVTGLGNIIGAAQAARQSRRPGGARAAARWGAPRPVRGEQAAPRDEGPSLLLSKLPPLARRWGSAFCYSFCRDSQRLGSLLCPGPARHGKEGPGAASPLERGGGRAGPLPGSGRPARNSNVLRLHSGRLLSRRAPRRPGTRPAGAGTVRRGRCARREPRRPPPRPTVLSTCR